MSDKAQKTILIKWVRSGIGLPFGQEDIVRSLGLGKLNHVVERPDTPQIRGAVAKVPHLLKIVPASPKPAWTSVPEYTIYPKPAEPPKAAPEASAPKAREVEVAETKPAVKAAEKKPAVKAAPRKAKAVPAKKPAAAKKSAAAGAKADKKVSKGKPKA